METRLAQRATAIQNQVYVLAPAQIGVHDPTSSSPTRVSWGESLAFDPWGKELGRLKSVEDEERKGSKRKDDQDIGEYFVVDIDLRVVE